MAKMTLRKKKTATAANITNHREERESKASTATPGNPHATLLDCVAKWREESDLLYLVELDGVKQGAVINADTKAEAKERFCKVFGISSTDRPIRAKAIDEDTAAAIHTDVNGVVDYFFDLNKHGGKPRQDDDRDDD